ncbi:Hypothetical predicted protein [Mytilus galloprovincialis]|uniref:Uncharacterized protein n=1 Tax=Mytilus galloprovincialis TaxID=29158 RepID=A0A8B6FKJ4_MYTGA|nr:Hypothetical predicted protein [Mytilus galloprovincialis]
MLFTWGYGNIVQKIKHIIKGVEYCLDLTDGLGHSNQLIVAQVLECFALFAFLASVTCAFLKMFVLKEQGMLFFVICLLNWLAKNTNNSTVNKFNLYE